MRITQNTRLGQSTTADLEDIMRTAIISCVLMLISVTSTLAQPALQLINDETASGNYVRVQDHNDLEPQSFCIELYFQPLGAGVGYAGDDGGGTLIAKPKEGEPGTFIISWYVGWSSGTNKLLASVAFTDTQGVIVYSDREIMIGEPVHLAVVFDGGSLSLFIDGHADSVVYYPYPAIQYGSQDVLLGASNFAAGYSREIDGLIDEVRFWDHPRTQVQICDNMYRTLSGEEAGLIAYWNFDDGTANDLTGNSHHGTLVGPTAAIVPGLWQQNGDPGYITNLRISQFPLGGFQLDWCPSIYALGYKVYQLSEPYGTIDDATLLTTTLNSSYLVFLPSSQDEAYFAVTRLIFGE
jgi:hypothetical protein